MENPVVTREGDSWRFEWAENHVAITFEFLSADESGFFGEFHVTSLGIGTVWNHVYRGRLNLMVADSKSKLATVLTRTINTVEWGTIIEVVAERVLQDYRWGEPTLRLDTLPKTSAPPHLIRGVLPFGETTVVFAAGGSGKSLIALAMGVAAASEKGFPCGIFPLFKVNVMYLDWETSPDEQRDRLEAICRGVGIPLPGIYYRPMYRPLFDEVKRIQQEVDRYNIGFIIIDSIAAACGGEPNSAENTIRFFNALRSLGTDVTKLVIAHTSKSGVEQTQGRATAFGSAFIEYYARSVWEIRRSEDDNDNISVGMFHRKVNRGSQQNPIGITISFSDTEGGNESISFRRYDLSNDPQLAAYANIGFRIRLSLRPGRKTTETLAVELNVSERTVTSTIGRMKGIVNLSPAMPVGTKTIWGLQSFAEEGS